MLPPNSACLPAGMFSAEYTLKPKAEISRTVGLRILLGSVRDFSITRNQTGPNRPFFYAVVFF